MGFLPFGRWKDARYITEMGKALSTDFGIAPTNSFGNPDKSLRTFARGAREAGLAPLEAVFQLLSAMPHASDLQAAMPDWSEDRYAVFRQRAAELCRQGRIRPSVYLKV